MRGSDRYHEIFLLILLLRTNRKEVLFYTYRYVNKQLKSQTIHRPTLNHYPLQCLKPKPKFTILTYRKGFDAPNENILFRDVADASDGGLELGRINVCWNRNHYLDAASSRTILEL